MEKERLAAYIDGFNLYFGLSDAGYQRFKWLNLMQLVQSLAKPNQTVVAVKYFTTMVSDRDKNKRQSTYIDALKSVAVTVHLGRFEHEQVQCGNCSNLWHKRIEKMTDVNLATHMLHDAHCNVFDTAMLISGDSDLIQAIRFVHSLEPEKSVFVAFPPERHNLSIAQAAHGSLQIGRKKLSDAQFAPIVETSTGFKLHKPREWYSED